jgi:predicted ATP-dependent protease
MATVVQQQRLRMDLGFEPDDLVSLSDATIDAIFVEAGEIYTSPASVEIAARVISLRRLVMQAANEVDYTNNETSEKASQRYSQLTREYDRWFRLLKDAEEEISENGNVRSGKPKQNPPRVKEYPGGWRW